MGKKIFAYGVFFILAISVLAGRTAWLTLVRGDSLAVRGAEQQLRSIDLYQYDRGDFLDRYNRPLTGQESTCLVVFPSLVEDAEKAAAALSPILGREEQALTVKMAGDSSKILETDLSSLEISGIESLDLPGIFLLPMHPRYSNPALAAHLIGFVGSVTKEEIAEQGLSADEVSGKSGLEKQYDSWLRGRVSPKAAVLVDERGKQAIDELRLLPAEENDTSNNVVLTLDLDYQEITETAMGQESGAVVVMEAATGDILAMVSKPGFDPVAGQTAVQGDAYVNKALYGYPPASVFKIVLVAAALEAGIAPEDFVCEGQYQLNNGHIVNCWKNDGHGKEDMATALANSCNPYFTNLGLMLGGDAILAYAKKFGLEEPQLLGYDLPETWPSLDFNTKVEGDVANASIGERGVRLSPVQVAQLMAVVANGGKKVTPRIVKEIRRQDGTLVKSILPAEPVTAIEESTAQRLREYLAGVVTNGTGRQAASLVVHTAGKTGTSQYQGVWFAGMAPAENPRWVVAIYLPEREAGGQEGAQIFKTIVEKIAVLEGL